MTDGKIREVLEKYKKLFDELGITDVDHPHDQRIACWDFRPALGHCRSMLAKMEKFLTEGRRDKVFRWLGFMQGVLWSHGIYSLDELKSHNMSDKNNRE